MYNRIATCAIQHLRLEQDTELDSIEQGANHKRCRETEKGFDGISVADLMKETGLTYGGFYGRFSSKEELMGLASQQALGETSAFYSYELVSNILF